MTDRFQDASIWSPSAGPSKHRLRRGLTKSSPSGSSSSEDDLPHAVFCFCGRECEPASSAGDNRQAADDDGDQIYCSTACARKDALLALSRSCQPSIVSSSASLCFASSSTTSLALPSSSTASSSHVGPLAGSSAHNARPPLVHSTSNSSVQSAGSIEHASHYRRMHAETVQLAAERQAAKVARRERRQARERAERQQQQQQRLGLGFAPVPASMAAGLGPNGLARSASNRSGREQIEAQRAVARLEQAKHRRAQQQQQQQTVPSAPPSLPRSSACSSLFGLGADLSRSNTAASTASSASSAHSFASSSAGGSFVSTHPGSRSSAYRMVPDLVHRRDDSQSSVASSSFASFTSHSASSSIGGYRPALSLGSFGNLIGNSDGQTDGLTGLAEADEHTFGTDDEEEEAVERIRIVSPLRRTGTLGKAASALKFQQQQQQARLVGSSHQQQQPPGMRMSDVLDEILEMERGFVVGVQGSPGMRRPTGPGLLPPVDLASPPGPFAPRAGRRADDCASEPMDLGTPPRPAFFTEARQSVTPRGVGGRRQPIVAPAAPLPGRSHARKRSLADAICSPSVSPRPAGCGGLKRRSASFSAGGFPVGGLLHQRTRSSPSVNNAPGNAFASRLSPAALFEEAEAAAATAGSYSSPAGLHTASVEAILVDDALEAGASATKRRKGSSSPPLPAARPRTLVYAPTTGTTPSSRTVSSYSSHRSASSAGGSVGSLRQLQQAEIYPHQPHRRKASDAGTGATFAFPSTASSTTLRALDDGLECDDSHSLRRVLDRSSSPPSVSAQPPLSSSPSGSLSLGLGSFFGGGGKGATLASRFPTMAADGSLSHEGVSTNGPNPGSPASVLAPALFPSSPGANSANVGGKTGERLWAAAFGGGASSVTAVPDDAAPAVASPRKWGWKW